MNGYCDKCGKLIPAIKPHFHPQNCTGVPKVTHGSRPGRKTHVKMTGAVIARQRAIEYYAELEAQASQKLSSRRRDRLLKKLSSGPSR